MKIKLSDFDKEILNELDKILCNTPELFFEYCMRKGLKFLVDNMQKNNLGEIFGESIRCSKLQSNSKRDQCS